MRVSRRELLAAAGSGLAGLLLGGRGKSTRHGAPLWDFHVHLFGIGDGGSGCLLSDAQRRRVNYGFFLELLGLRENGRLDQDYLEVLVRQLEASSIDRAVLLAQDGGYDRSGRFDRDRTSFYVPNDYLLEVAARRPSLLVPCVSINPRRRDAFDELERCVAKGARVLKVHPPTQDVDPAEPGFRPFWRRMAEQGVLLMVHTGTEHAAEIAGPELGDPRRLEPALEEGCTVLAAHAGMGSFFDREDYYPGLAKMMRRHPRLYCDTGNLASMFRWRNLPRMLADDVVRERIVHASDFPFPSNALVFWNRIRPGALLELCAERNLFERSLALERALGMPEEAFTRGASLLA